MQGGRFGHRLFLEREVGIEIHLCCLDRLMPEPKCNDGAIDAAWRSSMAAVCRSTGASLFSSSVEGSVVQRCRAAPRCLASRSCAASALSLPPRTLGKTMLSSPRDVSRSHALTVWTACFVNGVQRSFRPLPIQRTWAPVPKTTSCRRSWSSPIAASLFAQQPEGRHGPCGPPSTLIGSRKKGFDFGPSQKSNQLLLVTFGWHGQDSLDQAGL
jgi:hypothetical protein